MKITKTDVVTMLENYGELTRQAAQLEFEIQNYRPVVTSEDIIDTMIFGQNSDGVAVQTKTGSSDKTAGIALSYNERADSLNIKELDTLHDDLYAVTVQTARIRHYISLLDKRQSDILTKIYIEGMTLLDTAEMLGLSRATVQRNRYREDCRNAGARCKIMFGDLKTA